MKSVKTLAKFLSPKLQNKLGKKKEVYESIYAEYAVYA
jgi:hypothetical protein